MPIAQIDQSDSIEITGHPGGLSRLTGDSFYREWLAAQCARVPDCFFGLIVLRDKDSLDYQAVTAWPDEDATLDAASELMERVISEKSGLITMLETPPLDTSSISGTAYVLAYPVVISESVIAVVTLAIVADDKKALKYAMQQLQWGCGWLESMYWHELAVNTDKDSVRLSDSVDLLAKVLAENSFNAAAIRLVSELALLFKCDRVSIGLIHNKSIRISHLSHSAQFGKKMNLVRCIEAAMDEAVDQKESIIYPSLQVDSPEILLAHSELLDLQDSTSVMTIPLYVDYETFGAITLERNSDDTFSSEDVGFCEAVTALATGLLREKRVNDEHILLKIAASFKKQLSYLFGKEHYLYKTVVLSGAAVLLFLAFYQTDYRLSADAMLESDIRRSIVAPFDGYIDKALVRAGDLVSNKQPVLSLDVKDLHLERLKWLSQKEKLNRHYQESLSKHDRAKVKIINAQQDQAQAQLELVEMQLKRAEILAPFDGQVVNGDLSNRLGGAVSRGELLFEIAPLNSYRVKLLVKQSRIADVEPGQSGYLYLLALPGVIHNFTVMKITPVTESYDGQTYYEVEAGLHEQNDQLQLGMEGVGKINIDKRRLISIMMRDLLEWLYIQWWSLAG